MKQSVGDRFAPDEMSCQTLREDDIHVWSAQLDWPTSVVACLKASLSHDERDRADRFYFSRDRKRFIVCRGILRTILSSYLQTAPAGIRVSYQAHGKPALDAALDKTDNIQFNLSHSEGLALYAITRGRRIGIDLEKIRPITDMDQIARRFFSPREYAQMSSLPVPVKLQAFFSCWTRKEAYLKALGEGFSMDPDQFDVSLIPEEPAALLSVRGDLQEASRWSLYAFEPGPGYVAAVAVHGHNLKYDYWQWDCRPVKCMRLCQRTA